MAWPVKRILPLLILAALTACASAEKQKACQESCEQRFAKNLGECNRFSSHEANQRARERLLQACLKGEGWPNGQQDCRDRCQK